MKENHVVVEGCVKRDAQSNEIRSGLEVLNFCVCIPSDGGMVTYIDCVAYNEVQDALDGYVKANELLHVEGHLTHRTYTDAFGRRKSGIIIYVEEVWDIEEE